MAPKVDLFNQYRARSLQFERASVNGSAAVTTPAPTIAPELWPLLPPSLVKTLPSSQAPTFRPDEALSEVPDQVFAVEQQEGDYILRIFYVLWSAFLDFRQTTWNTHILDVQDNGMQTVIITDDDKGDRWNGFWSTFPEARIAALQDVHIRVGVLTAMSCLETAHLKNLTEQLFDGMKVTLEEISFRLKPNHPSTVFLSENKLTNPSAQDLWCLRVTSHLTHRQWAIHLSGPQYGKCEPGTEWNDFAREYIANDFHAAPFGTLALYAAAMSQTKGIAGMNHDLTSHAMQAFHASVDTGMAKKNLTWTDVLHKSDDDFMRHADKILRVGNKAVETWMKDTGGLGKRRQRAERWDKRHEGEMGEEHGRICGETLFAAIRKESVGAEGKQRGGEDKVDNKVMMKRVLKMLKKRDAKEEKEM